MKAHTHIYVCVCVCNFIFVSVLLLKYKLSIPNDEYYFQKEFGREKLSSLQPCKLEKK